MECLELKVSVTVRIRHPRVGRASSTPRAGGTELGSPAAFSRNADVWAWATVLNVLAVRWDPALSPVFGLTEGQLDALVPTARAVLARYGDEPRHRDDDFHEGEHMARGLRAHVDEPIFHSLDAVATMLPMREDEHRTTASWATVLGPRLDYARSSPPGSIVPIGIEHRLAKCRAALEARRHPLPGRLPRVRDDDEYLAAEHPEGSVWFSPHGCLALIVTASLGQVVMPILVGGLSESGRRGLLDWARNRAVAEEIDPATLVIRPKWEAEAD